MILSGWVGWVRYDWSVWQAVCSAKDWVHCRELLDRVHIRDGQPDGERLILRDGEHPTDPPERQKAG